MARTALDSAQIATLNSSQGVSVAAGAQDIGFAASDSINGNSFASSGKDIVLVKNTDASAQTVTITAVADSDGRTGSISTYSLAAGDVAWFGILDADGWSTDGNVYIDTSDNNVHIAVLRIP